jgi:hypothetical protein
METVTINVLIVKGKNGHKLSKGIGRKYTRADGHYSFYNDFHSPKTFDNLIHLDVEKRTHTDITWVKPGHVTGIRLCNKQGKIYLVTTHTKCMNCSSTNCSFPYIDYKLLILLNLIFAVDVIMNVGRHLCD